MKEKRCQVTPSPLREKIALWEGRKDGIPVKRGKGRSSGHAGRLFLNSLGKASKNGHGLSGERSDGRSHDEVPPIAKKDSDKQNISQDANGSAEGISRDSEKGFNENKISTLEFQKTSELNGSNDNGIIHFESKVNGTSSNSSNMISTFEFPHTTEKSDSNGMLIVDDIRATDVPTNSLHPTDGTDMQGTLLLDDTRTADLPSNSISPLQLQEIFTSEDSYSSLSPQETYYTPKNSDSSLLVQESFSLKDHSPSSFHEPHIPKDSNTTLPFQELHLSGDSNPTLELQEPFESNDSNCTSPLAVQESELLISSPNIDSSLSLQNNVSSPLPNHDLQAFCQSENENMSVRNQHQVGSESPPTTLFESCSPPVNDENILTLESSSFLKDSSTLLVSSQNQILTKSSTALEENNSSPLPTQNEDASTHPSSRGRNFIVPMNGYSVLGKYSDEDFMEEVSSSLSRRQTSSFRNEDLSIYLENETLKLELEMKDDKIAVLTRELSDLNFTGKAEEEVAVLKKAKHDLELKVKDQEEELDDLAGQVQMLEAARIRLEMSIEQTRKENRRELAQRDEEMEEVRMSAQKKIKGLEAQLEAEHDERTALVREKHDLERRLVDAHSRSFASVDEEAFHRVKKELKKTKALLKDTQTMLEKTQSEGSNKLLMRQLKTQLEDAEFAKNAAIKARQSAESDFSELQSQLEEALRAKKDTEDKLARVTKEKSEVQTQLEESEEEVAEVMKKYKATVSQLSVDQVNMSEQAQLISDLEHDKQVLQDRLTELSSKVEVLEGETANIHTQRRLQMKIKELESKLDLELTTRQRLESQITRLKDQVEKLSSECDSIRMKEMQAVDHGKKLNRQLREAKEDSSNLQQKLTDSTSRKQEIEKQYELAESEIMTLKSDLKLAFKRIEDLQQALQGDLSDSDTEMSESTGHDLRIHDVVMGGASLMTSIREEDGKESYA